MTRMYSSFASRLGLVFACHTKDATNVVPFSSSSAVPLQSASQRERKTIVKSLDGPNVSVVNLKPAMATWKSSLIHCQTNAIPAWAIDFEKLEFLHIEGKPESTNLVSLPDDLFAKMTTLTYLHLGMHLHLTYLPSFDGLSNLKSMTLAVITSLRDLPSLQPLQKVESLQLLFLTILQTAPDVETLPKLSNLLASSSQVCCNGVLGRCDTANSLCSSGVTCVTGDSGHQQKLEGIVEHFSQTVCSWDIPDLRVVTDSPPKELVDVCGGVMYRQCTLPGEADTMCYSNRK